MGKPTIVVTGFGAITPFGLTVEDLWDGLVAGRNGVGYITHFDTTDYYVKVAAEVKGFDPTKYMGIKTIDRTNRFTQFAIAATQMALKSAELDVSKEPDKVGVAIATTGDIYTIGEETEVLKKRGPKRVDPLFISKITAHMAPVQVGLMVGAKGPNSSINSGCASGSDAIGIALNHLRLGHADVMLAGGTDTIISPIAIAVAGIVGALSKQPDPAKASRPFDLYRDGFVYGEGAGILVLETYEHAQWRGATILAELAGAGWSFDAYSETAPDPEGQAQAMKAAIHDAEVDPMEIDYINAHGTSTKLNDIAETKAIKIVLEKRAYSIPVSSNKSMIGHLVAGAGAVEAIATILTINRGIIPSTINYETPDPECDLDYVPNKARQAEVNVCLSNSFGIGGQNCCLIFKRLEAI